MSKRLRKTEAQKRKVYVQHESLPPDLLAIKHWLDAHKGGGDTSAKRKGVYRDDRPPTHTT